MENYDSTTNILIICEDLCYDTSQFHHDYVTVPLQCVIFLSYVLYGTVCGKGNNNNVCQFMIFLRIATDMSGYVLKVSH